MAEKITIAEININTDSFLKSATATKTAISQLREEQSKLKKNGEENTEQFVKNEADLKNLSATYRQQSNVLTSLVASNGQLLKSQEAIAIALDKEIVSINDARASNSELLKIRNELDLSTKEGAKTADLINKKLDENNQFIKENVSQYEKQKINIGNYTESIKQAINETSIFGNSLSSLGTAFAPFKDVFTSLGNGAKDAINQIRGVGVATEGLTKAQQASAIATNAVSGALKLFRVALIATGIGAIVVVLGSLIAFLTTTQAGIDKVTAVTRPLQAVFQSLLGVLQNFGGILIDTFNNPQKAIKAFSDLIKEQVINRFTALKDIIVGIFTFDGDQFKKGIDATTEANEKLIGRVKEVGQATSKFFNDAIERGKEIDRLTKEIEKSEINLNKERAIATAREKELLLISKDTSRSGAEREKAAREIIKIKTEEAEKEANILKLRIELLKVNQQNNDTNRKGNKELADLEAELILKQQAGRDAEIEQIRVISAARKEAQAEATRLAKERVDNLIKTKEQEFALFQEQQRFAENNLEKQRTLADKEVEILKTKLKNKLISETEFQTAKLKIENDLKVFQEQTEADELKRIQTFEQKKKDLENQIALQRETDDQAKQELKLQQDFEKQVAELERLNLTEAEKTELLKLIEENRGIVLQEIRDKFDQDAIKKQQAVNDAILSNRKAQAQEEVAIVKQVTNMLVGLLGDSLGAQLAGIAIQAAVEAGLVKITTASAVARNLAQATASAPPPLNAPFIATALAQNAAMTASSSASIARILTGAALQGLGKVVTSKGKFEKGGLMEVGGNRHSQGGTKFVGSDGTRFEAEKGELIGVLNRNASQQFMNFNNAFGKRGGVGVSYAENGGIIARGLNSGQSDLEQIAILTAQAIAQAPPPVVTVEDINRVNSNVRVIENGASF
jgi:hypothetical protein